MPDESLTPLQKHLFWTAFRRWANTVIAVAALILAAIAFSK